MGQKITTIQQLFDLAGSMTQFAASMHVCAYTADNWRRTGVPIKWWDSVIKLYGLTPNDLYIIRKHCLSNK